MKSFRLGWFLAAAIVCLPASAQETERELTVLNPDPIVKQNLARTPIGAPSEAVNVPKLPIWTYSLLSPRDGSTYQGSIVGGNPFNRGARTTTVPVVIIPVRVVFTGTARTFDPTSPDVGCIGAGNTALSLMQASPIFQPSDYAINGVNVGNVTFIDAFQRAQFWPQVSAFAPSYHFAMSVTVAAKQTITVANGTSNGATFVTGACSTNALTTDNPPRLGVLDINFADPLFTGMIANLGLNASQFPLFVLYGVTMSNGSAISGPCCILGYHNGSGNILAPGQTYGVSQYARPGVFNGDADIATLSHEVLEWINDPSVNNFTPPWGGLGQVSGCQGNLETGDPLSGTLMPAVLMPNGVTYHPQENAFFSWFLGVPGAGAGGKYSSNGTFGGFAKACPPGGTN